MWWCIVYSEFIGIWIRALEKPKTCGANASESDKFGVFCTVIFTPRYVGVLLLYIEGNRVIYSMTFRTPDHHFPMMVFCFGFREMWRVFVFLFIMFPFSVFAGCVSVEKITKCARLPTNIGMHGLTPEITDGAYDGDGWGGIYNGHMLSGVGTNSGSGIRQMTECVIDWPFYATGKCLFSPFFDAGNGNYNCANAPSACDLGVDFKVFNKLPDDICPDGFYTVPYEVSCGDGLIDVSGLPQCDSDMSGDYCLIGEVKTPCAAGITTLLTGTGLSIPLWAERGTEPSLCVKYNDTVCYGNLEPGQAANTINVNYNGVVYHTVD